MEITTLSIKNLTKVYKGNTKANDNISLEFKSGEITALVGHNGAGKTTLLNQIIGLLRPTSGEIFVNDTNIVNNPSLARKIVSSMPQFQVPLKGVSILQAIESILRIRGFSKEASREKTLDIIKELQLEKWKDVTGENLSGGLQRLTSFAMSVTSGSPVVVLDEPTNDVDPVRRIIMWKYLRKLAGNGTIIIIVTHNLLEVEKYADRYILLDKGIVKKDKAISEGYLSDNKHALNIFGTNNEIEKAFDIYDTKYCEEEKRLSVFLDKDEVINAVNLVLDLFASGQIINYDMKICNLYDDYEDIINGDN
ncbi:MAG: ABC transporter ATP-binding protein [Peptoanaerobacter stomatis]|uniref:ABC transporter ATP-binding protein n=1 Tax=Peptoanaerobacter stomatis TaxID=796937 RepID=UPI003F9F799C